jgi:endonuclease YncB( thermonuclease family)
MDIQPNGETAAIWSGALQAAATILAGRGDAARWGIDDPAGWAASAGAVSHVRDGDTIEVAGRAIRLQGLAAPEGMSRAAPRRLGR